MGENVVVPGRAVAMEKIYGHPPIEYNTDWEYQMLNFTIKHITTIAFEIGIRALVGSLHTLDG